MAESLKRGDLVAVADSADYLRKPRPAVIVQSSALIEVRDSVIVCLLTTADDPAVRSLRPFLKMSVVNGLKVDSAVMAGKLIAVSKARIGAKPFGKLTAAGAGFRGRGHAPLAGPLICRCRSK